MILDRYDVVMKIEAIYSTLLSISRGDSAATEECLLYISEETVLDLMNAAEAIKEYMLDIIRTEDLNCG